MKNMRVNLRRGLFRVWVILSCLWAILACAVGFGGVREEFARAASAPTVSAVHAPAVSHGPWEDYAPKGPAKKPSDRPLTVVHSEPLPQEKPSSTPPVGQITPPAGYKLDAPDQFGGIPVDCVPPKQGTYTDADIDIFDKAAALAAPHPWRMVREMIAWAVAPPIGMFILGLSCLWAIAGFARTESAS